MGRLSEFDVSQNRLIGEIPGPISSCLMLEHILMNNNLFKGTFPSIFNTLKSLHVLDLSRNNISEEIPSYLQNFTLLLNLSFNELKGEVRQEGVFRNESAFKITGNSNLCGGIKSLGLPICEIQASNRNDSHLLLK